MPTPAGEKVQTLHATCSEQTARLVQALDSLKAMTPSTPNEISLALIDNYKMKSLLAGIQAYQRRLPLMDAAFNEHSPRVSSARLYERGEIIELDSMDLHQAQVVCDGYRRQVDDCLFDVHQSQQLFRKNPQNPPMGES